jgi:hypothetical protein
VTNQEVFDTVARHLLRQGRQSVGYRGCAYRGPNGLRCAIGCLIPDREYAAAMEGSGIHGPVEAVLRARKVNLSLAYDLQVVHDNRAPSNWRIALRGVADNYRLSLAVLEEAAP